MQSALTSLALALTLGLTSAQDTTTAATFGNGAQLTSDSSTLQLPALTSTAASIVSINALETTYEVSCLESAPTETCSIADPWTIIQGISTYSVSGVYTAFDRAPPLTVTVQDECSFESWSASASCTYSATYAGSSDGAETSSSFSLETGVAEADVTYYRLMVTGGVEKMSEPEATETPEGAAAWANPVKAVVTAAPVVIAGVVAAL
ncbi:hypothetical protein BDW62DRAFT_198370 [Aspergillus aurantiobrunneus]